MSIRVILADDHQIMRDGLRSLLEKQPDIEIIADAPNGRTAIKLVEEMSPNIVVMDVAMPDLNGMEATRQIIARAPSTKVIALSMYSHRRFVAGMLGAGASGYLLKDCAFEELAQAIRTVAAGQTYLSSRIVDVVLRDYVNSSEKAQSQTSFPLTAREREVLQLLAEGNSVKEIASSLVLSTKTIETHRQRIMRKLNLKSIAALTKYAVREGLTSLEK